MGRKSHAGPQPSWVSLTTSQQDEIAKYASCPGWQILSQDSIPSVFPEGFRQKLDSAVVIGAPTSSGGTYVVFNAKRVDEKARMIDDEPFAVIVNSTGPDVSGMFLHHGDWETRTQPGPTEFWEQVDESGVGNYMFTNPPSGQSSGDLSDLPAGDRAAFDSAVRHLRGGST